MPETVIEVLNEVFERRDWDLSLLSSEEFTNLSDRMTAFAHQFEAPVRNVGTTRFYAGGTIWNPNSQNSMVNFGPAGLISGAYVDQLQTLTLVHDTVVCHDALTDTLTRRKVSFLPSFYSNIHQGEEIYWLQDVPEYGPIPEDRRQQLIHRLNPILRVYDRARWLISKGFLIPVPTSTAMLRNKDKFLCQHRNAMSDGQLKSLAKEDISIAVTDSTLSLFMTPTGGRQVSLGKALDVPLLRLHYGTIYHLKCLCAAFLAKADYTPFDEFGWRVLQSKYDELFDQYQTKSGASLQRLLAKSAVTVPLVTPLSIDDVVAISLVCSERSVGRARRYLWRAIQGNRRPARRAEAANVMTSADCDNMAAE